MSRWAEGAVALGVAAGLHLAAFAAAPQILGSRASGDQGRAEVSLTAAGGSLAALVDNWTAPPETGADPSLTPAALPAPADPKAATAAIAPDTPVTRDATNLDAPDAAPALPERPDPVSRPTPTFETTAPNAPDPNTPPQLTVPAEPQGRLPTASLSPRMPATPPPSERLDFAIPEGSLRAEAAQSLLAPLAPRALPATPGLQSAPSSQPATTPPPSIRQPDLPEADAAPTLDTEPNVSTASDAPSTSPRPVHRPVQRPDAAPETRNAPAPAQPRTAQPAARAAGSGATARAGEAGQSNTAARNAAEAEAAARQWQTRVDRRLRRVVARNCGRSRTSGQLDVTLRIDRSGQLLRVVVRAGAGQSALEDAMRRALGNAGRFPAAPSAFAAPSADFRFAFRGVC